MKLTPPERHRRQLSKYSDLEMRDLEKARELDRLFAQDDRFRDDEAEDDLLFLHGRDARDLDGLFEMDPEHR